MIRLASALCLAAALAFPQSSTLSRTMTEGAHRMELVLERLDRDTWRTIDPGLVLAQGDRVRFKFRTNFDGYLYVMNQSTSGTYEQLFPREETGQDNRIAARSSCSTVGPPAISDTTSIGTRSYAPPRRGMRKQRVVCGARD